MATGRRAPAPHLFRFASAVNTGREVKPEVPHRYTRNVGGKLFELRTASFRVP